MTNNKISLCMIVKNEERWIEQCLSSVISWIDEMIVVDTGSSDATTDIARSMGAQVFYYKWDDDFSRARNFSISKATGDWILVLDADEVIATADVQKIKKMAELNKADMYRLIQTTYCQESATLGWIPNNLEVPEAKGYPGYLESPLIRFFKNSGEIFYEGCVHEHPRHNDKKVVSCDTNVRIHHYGKYTADDVRIKKEDLYLKLGLEKCRQNPNDSHAWYELGVQYWGMHQEEKAEEAFLKSEELDPNFVRPKIALAGIATIKKAYPNAIKYYSRVMDLDSQNIVPYLYLPTILIEMGNIKLAQDILKYGQRYANEHPPFHINRGIVYQSLGNHRLAIECFDEALRINQDESLAIYNKGLSYQSLDDHKRAIEFYSQVINDKKIGLLARKKLVEIFYKDENYSKAIEMVDSSMAIYPDDEPLLFQRAVLALRTREIELAKKMIDKIADFTQFDSTGLINLKQCCMLVGDVEKADRVGKFLLHTSNTSDTSQCEITN